MKKENQKKKITSLLKTALTLVLCINFVLLSHLSKAQLNITPLNNLNKIDSAVRTVLIGNGVSVTNISFNAFSVSTGGAIPLNVIGVFNNGNTTNLGLTSGIVFSTGSVTGIPNTASTNLSIAVNSPGDPSLQTLASNTVYDAATLEFDFVPMDTFIRFRYIFGSEEYPEYVCSNFNDVFGFFITGPNPEGGNYVNKNIAILPGTNLPVAINTVNPGTVGQNGTASNCQAPNGSLAYSNYYVNNTGGQRIAYDGFTSPLEAYAKVVPCNIYHIKLAVGDVGDRFYDSGVFLEANSFASDTTEPFIQCNRTGQYYELREGCDSLVVSLSSLYGLSNDFQVNLYFDNLPNNGTEYETLPNVVNIPASSGAASFTIKPKMDNINPETNDTLIIRIKKSNCAFIFDTVKVVILNNTMPQAQILKDTVLCQQQIFQLTALATNGQPPYQYQWQNASTLPTLNVMPITGNNYYFLTVTDACNNKAIDTVNVVLSSPPQPTLNTREVSVCSGTSVNLIAGGASAYNWSTGQTTATITLNPTSSSTITVTFSNTCGVATDTVRINITTQPTANAGNDVHICFGETAYLYGSGGTSYAWSNSVNTAANPVIVTSTQTFTLTTTSSCGTATDEVTVFVNLAPVNPSVLPYNPNICHGDTVNLVATAGYSYVWSTLETTAAINITAIQSTAYSVTVYNQCGSAISQSTVNVIPLPVANAGADVDLCYGHSVSLEANGIGNISWNTGDTTSTITVQPLTTTTYSLSMSNMCGTATDDVVVNVSPEFQPTVSNPIYSCYGATQQLVAGGGTSYLWSTGATTASINVVATQSQNYFVIVSTNCETDTLYTEITIRPLPVANAGQDVSICIGESVTLTGSGIGNYLWNTGDTTAIINVNPVNDTSYFLEVSDTCASSRDTVNVFVLDFPEVDAISWVSTCAGHPVIIAATGVGNFLWNTGETTSFITVNPQNTTVYSITASNQCGTATDTVTVVVKYPPSIPSSSHYLICSGSPITLVASGGTHYIWTTGQTSSSIVVSPLNTSIYTVTVSNSCGSATATYTVETTTLPVANAGSDKTICIGNSVSLTAIGGSQYLWSTGDTSASIVVVPNNTTNYFVTVSSSCGVATDEVFVYIYNPGSYSIDISSPNVCTGTPIDLSCTGGSNPNAIYSWNISSANIISGSLTTAGPITVVWNQNGVYPVSVSITDSICQLTLQPLQISVDSCVSVNQKEIVAPVKVFPVPADEFIDIAVNSKIRNVYLTDLLGKTILSETIAANKDMLRLNLAAVPSGTYIIVVVTDDGVNPFKIQVQH